MKNLGKFLSTAVLCIFSVSTEANALQCTTKVTSPETAKKCVEEFLLQPDKIYAGLEIGNHVGDIRTCPSKNSPPAYFTNDESSFRDGILEAEIISCSKDTQLPDQYVCYIKSGPQGCAIKPQNSNKITKTSRIQIGATNPTLIGMFPLWPRS